MAGCPTGRTVRVNYRPPLPSLGTGRGRRGAGLGTVRPRSFRGDQFPQWLLVPGQIRRFESTQLIELDGGFLEIVGFDRSFYRHPGAPFRARQTMHPDPLRGAIETGPRGQLGLLGFDVSLESIDQRSLVRTRYSPFTLRTTVKQGRSAGRKRLTIDTMTSSSIPRCGFPDEGHRRMTLFVAPCDRQIPPA